MRVVTIKEGLGFKSIGVDLAEIRHPHEPPSHWEIRYHPLMAGERYFPGVSITTDREYAYLYTVIEPTHAMILTRLALDRLTKGVSALSYFGEDGQWKIDPDWRKAKVLIDKGATEMSVRYWPKFKKWVAIHGGPSFPSNEILIRTAPALAGPWSGPSVLYRIPDPARLGKNIFCYAAKEQHQFAADPATALVTYACNSLGDWKTLVTNMEIYHPLPIRLDLSRWLK